MRQTRKLFASIILVSALAVTGVAASPEDRPMPTVDTKLDDIFAKKRADFDSEEWHNNIRLYRTSMLSDFVHRYKLIGMRKSRVHKLLGEPLPELWKKQIEFSGDQLALDVYNLCYRECGMPPVWYLEFKYKGDHASAFRIRTLGHRGKTHFDDCSSWIMSLREPRVLQRKANSET